jgi:hypothetical protein
LENVQRNKKKGEFTRRQVSSNQTKESKKNLFDSVAMWFIPCVDDQSQVNPLDKTEKKTLPTPRGSSLQPKLPNLNAPQ